MKPRTPLSLRAILVLLFLAAFALPGFAQIPGFDDVGAQGGDKVTVRTEVVPQTARPGEVVTLKAILEVIPGWHVYGRLQNPDLGSPTELDVEDSGRLVPFGPTLVPVGEPHGEGDFATHDLEGVAILTQRFVVPADAEKGEITLKGTVSYMACDANNCDDPRDDPWSAKVVIEEGEPRAEHALKKVEILRAYTKSAVRNGEVVDVIVELLVKEGHYVYGAKETTGTKTSLEVKKAPDGFEVQPARIPDGEEHEIEGLDESSFHLVGKIELVQPMRLTKGIKPGVYEVEGSLGYQVCDKGSCDLPATMAWTAEIAVEKGAARADRLGGSSAGAASQGGGVAGGMQDKGLWWLIVAAIGGALFALAMPCTYPMIPITISFFTKQAEARGGKVLPLALVYGFGIIAIFVGIGVIVGGVVVDFATHWVTNLVIGLFFLVFALSLFGLFTLQPPKFLMSAAGKASTKGGYTGVFLMGATLVITSFTCTAPFVGNILAVGAQGGVLYTALGMAIFGLTMAIPFVALSLVPGAVSAMPNSGMWMNTLKVFLGFVEVAAALKFLSNVDLVLGWQALSREMFLFLWAAIFAIAGYYLLGRIQLKGESPEIGPGRLVGGLSVLLLAVYFGSGALGNQLDWVSESIAPNYSTRKAWASGGGGAQAKSWQIVKDDYDEAHRVAKAKGKLLLLNITGVT